MPPSSSVLWTWKRKPPGLSADRPPTPPHRSPANSRAAGGHLSERENLSESVDPPGQQPAPTPTPSSNNPQPRAFRKVPARPRPAGPPRRAKGRAPLPFAGGASSLPPGLRSPPPHSYPAQRTGARKNWENGGPRACLGARGTVEIDRSGAGRAASPPPRAHHPGRAERPFPAAGDAAFAIPSSSSSTLALHKVFVFR